MKILMKIEGMSCKHCEAAVKKALEAHPEVEKVVVSIEKGIAEIWCKIKPDVEKLKKAVEEAGYKVEKVIEEEDQEATVEDQDFNKMK